MIGIYKITNNINGKVYIGQSRCIEKRWAKHRSAPFNPTDNSYNNPLYKSIRKNGLNNFIFEVIEECSVDNLNEREIYWIKYYNSSNLEKGYNLTEGGNNAPTSKILTKENVNDIINLLKNTTKSQEEIAQLFKVSQREISGINLGQNWLQSNIEYPIRERTTYKHTRCEKCGKQISCGAHLCHQCYHESRQKVNKKPNRDELKQQIRTMPMIKVGELYGVSDNAIRKWCVKLNLPSKVSEIKSYTDKEWELL